jgi:hypothetical protein
LTQHPLQISAPVTTKAMQVIIIANNTQLSNLEASGSR